MSGKSSGFAVLIIHGGYFFASAWDDFRARLAKNGIESACPQLPSCGDKGTEKAGQPEDIAAVQTAARDLIGKGHRIVALAHSYGGVVACGALEDELLAKDKQSSGIAHVVFLSAWIPQPGNTLEDIIKKYGFLSKVELGFTEDGCAYSKNAAETFFNDINETDKLQADELAAATTTHNWVANTLAVQGAPYKKIPSTYIQTTRDLSTELPLQKNMVNDMVHAGGSVQIVEIDSGHCPFLSKPEELLQILIRVGEQARDHVGESSLKS